MIGNENILSLQEAASVLRICTKTLAKLIKKGKIEAKRTCEAKNAPYRILRENLLKFLNE